MTWGEFKAEVELQGLKDDSEILYLDCGNDPHVNWIPDVEAFSVDNVSMTTTLNKVPRGLLGPLS